MFYSFEKSISIKKSDTSHYENVVSFFTQKSDNVATPYYPIFVLYYLSSGILWESKHERHSLALKVIAVAYEKWSLTTGSKYNDSTGNLEVFLRTIR